MNHDSDTMEPVAKSPRLSATSPAEEQIVDRLSFLPNHVAHHIVSFLPIEDLANLSLASKMCEKLCLTVPSLVISLNNSKVSCFKTPIERIQFLDFLVNFMRRHRGTKLTKLRIMYDKKMTNNEKSRIMWILNQAMECHVDDLDLCLHIASGSFLLPSDVFWCKSLKNLKVNMWKGKLELPTWYGVSYIKRLHISHTEVVEGSLGEWILHACKFLEELRFEEISGLKMLKISSSSLLDISIKRCQFEYLNISAQLLEKLELNSALYGTASRSLTLNTPNLVDLHWTGTFTEIYYAEKFNSLQSAYLSLWHYQQKNWKLDRLLPSVAQASHLEISWDTIKALYESGCLPFMFENLQTLDLSLRRRTDLASGTNVIVPETLASFLRGLPCSLKKLNLIQTSLPDCPKFWESHKFRFVKGLEEMRINLVGGVYEEEMLEHFLENAKELKTLTLFSGSSLPTNTAAKLMAAAVARGAGFRMEQTGYRLERRKMVLDLTKPFEF